MSGVGVGRGNDQVAEDLPAKGYYDRFFREEARLGMGAEGSVYLATHVIGENILGERMFSCAALELVPTHRSRLH
jgi:hypothetical protein